MRITTMRRMAAVTAAVAMAVALQTAAGGQSAAVGGRIDQLFARWTSSTPGCAVGAAAKGTVVAEKGYGMADLEHDVPNGGATIFEAGSVSKQFTAAAVLLLARDGKLSLDDPVRRHIPELPDYGAPLTIRHMLTHTSGLRDWGSVAAIGGWPRTTRVHTHAHVLDIVSRQKALNFTPGTRWSYSNTGYNLAAVIVGRVSGMSFAEFSRTRIFEPLGMTRTSWRDDHTRIVKGRATAYSAEPDGYHIEMPFENVHGNGGLLTTVGDLLKWNANYVTQALGGPAHVAQQQEVGRFADGREHDYAFGLRIARYKGVREVGHSGSTAGYRAYLAWYPDQGVSVAVLCNAGNANAGQHAHAVADLLLGDAANGDAQRPAPIPGAQGPLAALKRDESYRPSAAALAAFAGTYDSGEAEATLTIAVEGDALVLERRPGSKVTLRPRAADTFDGGVGTLVFRRGADGRVAELSVVQDRVWDLRFRRR